MFAAGTLYARLSSRLVVEAAAEARASLCFSFIIAVRELLPVREGVRELAACEEGGKLSEEVRGMPGINGSEVSAHEVEMSE